VHGVRRTLKEARAIARLFLPSLGEPGRVTIAALAVVRRRVGRMRDLDVIEARLARLAPPPEIAAPLVETIERERAVASRAHSGFATSASRTYLNAIVKPLESWQLTCFGADDIVKAVARTYRQARRRGKLAFRSDDPAALRALRARVVDLRYQLATLSSGSPAALNALSEELNLLRDTLGDFNDLHVLSTFAAEHFALTPEALGKLMAQIAAKQKKLRGRAATMVGRLFSDTPDTFAERLSDYLL
jgi:CHAD domain-containing protein